MGGQSCKKIIFFALVLILALIENGNCKKDQSGKCKKVKNKECHHRYQEIYKDVIQNSSEEDDSGDTKSDDYSSEDTIKRLCCTKNSDKAKKEEKKAIGCQTTYCMDPNDSGATEDQICTSLPTRYVNGKKLEYEETIRDKCELDYGDVTIGTQALCCPKNSKEAMLTLLLGAETHQFPHFALVHVGHPDDNGVSVCGGTIYNERYIITASHCMLSDGVMRPANKSKVELDVKLANFDKPNVYEIEKFIAHPNSTRWNPNATSLYNDVGLIKLKKKIKFGPYIKALPIAKTGFDPFKYSNETVLIGVGDTDTTLIAHMLQRVRTYLRQDKKNIENKRLWGNEFTMKQADGILFLGGIQDGVTAPRSGPGDSGGPAICRNENGFAVMCGLDSSGPDLARCEKKLDEHACMPLAYMEAQHFYKWFVDTAGDQSKAEVLWQPLFGAPVPDGKYEHQVRITSKNGPSCGGTLLEKDIVLTAAHCVVDDNGNNKQDVKVYTGLRNLKSLSQGKKLDVKEVKVLDGFKRGSGGTRARRIARLNVKPTPKYPYYKNDLALLKLASKTDISSKKLPKLGPAPREDNSDNVVWTTEVSFPTDTSRSGSLQQREFKILENRFCQKRMNRASYANVTIKVDDNIMCGEEMYNGGAQCDRELGGGLICKGKDGKDVLCGIQTFRFCQLALPSAFLDVNRYKSWIDKAKLKENIKFLKSNKLAISYKLARMD